MWQHSSCKGYIIWIISGIRFSYFVIAKSGSGRIICSLFLYNIPDIIKILSCIISMAYDDIICFCLGSVCKTGLPYCSVIYVSGPAVRLNADSNVDLGYFQGITDIPYIVVVRSASVCACDGGIMRCNGLNTSIKTSFMVRGISIGICILK